MSPIADLDWRHEPPRFAAVRPRERFAVVEDGVRHELDPTCTRLAPTHRWVLAKPELWDLVERVDGQSERVYREAAARTRSELSRMCGVAARMLERGGATRTVSRAPDPSAQDELLGWGRGGSGLQLPPSRRPLRLP